MGKCDLCNADIGPAARRYSASEMRTAVRAGLRPPASLSLHASLLGVSGPEWHSHWVQQVMTDTTDWALCPECVARVEQHLAQQPSRLTAAAGPAAVRQEAPAENTAVAPPLPQTTSAHSEPQSAPTAYQERIREAEERQARRDAESQVVHETRSERPGCVTAYAILLGIGAASVALASFLIAEDVGVGAPLIGLVVAALYFLLIRGLWQMRNWARVLVLVFNGLGIAGNVVTICASLSADVGGIGILGSLAGLIIPGIVFYWFYSSRDLFS